MHHRIFYIFSIYFNCQRTTNKNRASPNNKALIQCTLSPKYHDIRIVTLDARMWMWRWKCCTSQATGMIKCANFYIAFICIDISVYWLLLYYTVTTTTPVFTTMTPTSTVIPTGTLSVCDCWYLINCHLYVYV